MGYTGKDQSPSLEFQEYTERKGKRRQTTEVVTHLFPVRKERGPGTHLRAQLEEELLSGQDWGLSTC